MICFRCGCVYAENSAACPMCGAATVPSALAGPEDPGSVTAVLSSAPEPGGPSEQPAIPFIYGGFWRRFWALLLDGVVLASLALLVNIAGMTMLHVLSFEIADSVRAMFMPQLIANTLMKACYFIYFHAETGQTVGKKAFGLKVVQENGQLIGWPHAAGRYVGAFVSLLAFGLGYLWVVVDERKQGWHDKVAGSYVVRV